MPLWQIGKTDMNTDTYTYLLAHPQEITPGHMQQLATVVETYPYFQSARALQLKGLKKQNSFLYNDALKITAAYTTDRDVLFEYITSEAFVQDDISEAIKGQDLSEGKMKDSEASKEQLTTEMKKAEAIFNPELFERKLQSVTQIANTPESTSEENQLKPDAPLEFKKEDTHSFSEWLKLSKAVPIKRSPEVEAGMEESNGAERKFELIEKFIQKRPKIRTKEIEELPVTEKRSQKDLSEPYTQAPEALMTETLAKVYVQQKNYKKAIQAYKILILKYPEKSGFFADQIRTIKKLTNTKES
jgi:hypothetical protein